MVRIAFYIDGFNLYHVIEKYCPHCKWLDLQKMVHSIVSSSAKISRVCYFTALANWKLDGVARHRVYISALNTTGVHVVCGRFKEKERYCWKCKSVYNAHEEKQTDVNIALQMLEDAIDDRFDEAILVSGDTDFVPILRTIKRRCPKKRIGVLLPVGSQAKLLVEAADYHIKMKRFHLERNQLPHVIEAEGKTITIPEKWKNRSPPSRL